MKILKSRATTASEQSNLKNHDGTENYGVDPDDNDHRQPKICVYPVLIEDRDPVVEAPYVPEVGIQTHFFDPLNTS